MDTNEKVFCCSWGFLGEWWHVDKDATREEIVDAVYAHTQVDATKEQVAQRLYGGFPCDEGGIHIYHSTGKYTYIGTNGDLDESDRSECWNKLISGNKDQFHKLDRTALFTENMPAEIPVEEPA